MDKEGLEVEIELEVKKYNWLDVFLFYRRLSNISFVKLTYLPKASSNKIECMKVKRCN
jgi:hypothetical protein